MNKKSFLKVLFCGIFLFFTNAAFSQVEDLEEKKEFNPKPASASVYNLGLKSYEQGDIESATSFFKRAVELDPDFVDAYFNLGAIYKKQENLPLAIYSFQKAVNLNPEDDEAIFELANCYFQEKNYNEAKKYFSLIPQDFVKYKEAKKNLNFIATLPQENQTAGFEQPAITTKPAENFKTTGQEISQEQAALLVNTLTKPSKDTFKEPFKVVTGNLNGPTGITKDSKNNIYIANFTRDAIERIGANGKREVFVEKLGLSGPVGLATDENDNLFVANYSGDSIIKITPARQIIVLVNKIVKPYYLFYDNAAGKLFATVQGNDSLVEVDTLGISKQPVTSR